MLFSTKCFSFNLEIFHLTYYCIHSYIYLNIQLIFNDNHLFPTYYYDVLNGLQVTIKEMPTSPHSTAQIPQPSLVEEERPELLGSLTTQQQQRTSARVIKKLLLDDAAADRDLKKGIEAKIEANKNN